MLQNTTEQRLRFPCFYTSWQIYQEQKKGAGIYIFQDKSLFQNGPAHWHEITAVHTLYYFDTEPFFQITLNQAKWNNPYDEEMINSFKSKKRKWDKMGGTAAD